MTATWCKYPVSNPSPLSTTSFNTLTPTNNPLPFPHRTCAQVLLLRRSHLVPVPSISLASSYQTFFPALVPASIHTELAIRSLAPFLLFTHDQAHQILPQATVQKLLGFSFSKYNFLQNTPTLLVSQETFTQLFGSEHAHNRLVIKLKEGLSDRDYATIVDTTRSL